jgi:hypothetical protein
VALPMPPVKGSATAGSAAALIPRPPVSGCGWRPLDSVGPWPTGVCAGQSASVRHLGRNARSQLGDIGGTSARRVISDDRDDPGICMSSPEGPVFGVSRRILGDAGVWGVHNG